MRARPPAGAPDRYQAAAPLLRRLAREDAALFEAEVCDCVSELAFCLALRDFFLAGQDFSIYSKKNSVGKKLPGGAGRVSVSVKLMCAVKSTVIKVVSAKENYGEAPLSGSVKIIQLQSL